MTPPHLKEDYPECEEYITVTGLHSSLDIVHYTLKAIPDFGLMHSGMYFNDKDCKEYK